MMGEELITRKEGWKREKEQKWEGEEKSKGGSEKFENRRLAGRGRTP